MASTVRARPTRDGWVLLTLTGAIGAVATAAGNNLLMLIVASLITALLIQVLAGSWNLRGLNARRGLPADLFADAGARGRLAISNSRRLGASFDVRIVDDQARAPAVIAMVPPGSEASAATTWHFPTRGYQALGRLRIVSTFPFGLMEHSRIVARPNEEVVVYPRLSRSRRRPQIGEDAGDHDAQRGRGQGGEHNGLRPYRPGDRLAAIHWPTTARLDEMMVVQRVGESQPVVDIVLEGRPGPGWEDQISRAAGNIVEAGALGYRVALAVPALDTRPAHRLGPDAGARWRRSLLETLARLPALTEEPS